jgi:hypothetical protein
VTAANIIVVNTNPFRRSYPLNPNAKAAKKATRTGPAYPPLSVIRKPMAITSNKLAINNEIE